MSTDAKLSYHYKKGFDSAAGALLRGDETPESLSSALSQFQPGEREAGIQGAIERFRSLRDFAAADPGSEEAQQLCAEIEALQERLSAIGNYAHDHSTGPAVPDALWEIRAMAYENKG